MTTNFSPQTETQEKTEAKEIPWGLKEILRSLLFLFFFLFILGGVTFLFPAAENWAIFLTQASFILPPLFMLLIKKAKGDDLGLRAFTLKNLAIGYGLLFASYIVILIHNMLLVFLNIPTQGDYISELFNDPQTMSLVLILGVIVAPIVEEIYFRAFFFGGLQEKYGWKKAAFFSSLAFSLAHMQLVSLIPTFVLGMLFAYLYHRAKSIFPSIILHFSVNAFSFGMLYLAFYLEGIM